MSTKAQKVINFYKHLRLSFYFSFQRAKKTKKKKFYRHFVTFRSIGIDHYFCVHVRKKRKFREFYFQLLNDRQERLKKNKKISSLGRNKNMFKAVFLFGSQIARELKIARIYFGIPVYFIENFLPMCYRRRATKNSSQLSREVKLVLKN